MLPSIGIDTKDPIPATVCPNFYQRTARLFTVRTCAGLMVFATLLLVSPLFLTGKLSTVPVYVPYHGIDDKPLWNDLVHGKVHPLQPNVCPPNGQHPYLVLFIPSRPSFANERAAVRETWGSHARLCNIRIVFGFGSFESTEVQHETFIENRIYGDLLQTGNVVDAYHNQTKLILSFFEWGASNCQHSKFIGKADEDTWLTIFGILEYLRLPEALHSITGHFLFDENVKRLPEEKWFLTREEYSNDTYPPFAVGQLYIFPAPYLLDILAAARTIPIHWLDDVFIGGQIPALLKMKLLHVAQRSHLWEVENRPCFANDFYIIHAAAAEQKRRIFYDPCMEKYRQSECPYRVCTYCSMKTKATQTARSSPIDGPFIE